MMYPFFDPTIIMLIPALLFSMWAQFKVKGAFAKYSEVRAASGFTAEQVSRRLLDANGLQSVRIERVPGELTDHYDPRDKTLRLSSGVYESSSVAALGIAAHEVGHAVQHAVGYAPLAIRNGLVPVVQLVSNAAFPLFLIGLITQSGFLMDLGLLFFLGAVIFQIVTLPVEYDASKRAINMLEGLGFVAGQESVAVGNMLNAAALTYVAATAMALAQFMRLFLLRGRRD